MAMQIRKILVLAFLTLSLNGTGLFAMPNIVPDTLLANNVVSRGTSRLYWGNECLTLYPNGKCVLTQGDSVRIEGTYAIKDGWVVLYFEGGSVSCKATIDRDGSVKSVSYNGNIYRKK